MTTNNRPPRRWSKCLGCGIGTQSAISVCRSCQTTTDERPRSACTTCGRRCRSISGLCAVCLHPDAAPLTGGRWVQDGLIRRWRPWTAEECAERTRSALRAFPTSPAFDDLQAARKRLHVLINECRPATREVA